MKVFLGSSTESLDCLRTIASWIEEQHHEAISWDNPELFLPGGDALSTLIEIAHSCEAALFIFSEDDKIWYRQDTLRAPRDNVIFEYGLFVGILGKNRAVICKRGQPKEPSDLRGLNYLDVSEGSQGAARIKLNIWLRKVNEKSDGTMGNEHYFRKLIDDANEKILFLEQSTKDLIKKIAPPSGKVRYAAQWKGLFNYEFSKRITEMILIFYLNAKNFEHFLSISGFLPNAFRLSHDEQWGNPHRQPFLVRKCLRVLRQFAKESDFDRFMDLQQDNFKSAILAIPIDGDEGH